MRETIQWIKGSIVLILFCFIALGAVYPAVSSLINLAFSSLVGGGSSSSPSEYTFERLAQLQIYRENKGYFSPRPTSFNHSDNQPASQFFSSESQPECLYGRQGSEILNRRSRALNLTLSEIMDSGIDDMITVSSSGLDPHITLNSALVQAKRVAQMRKIAEGEVKRLIYRHYSVRSSWTLFPSVVNVLSLNEALDSEFPLPLTESIYSGKDV